MIYKSSYKYYNQTGIYKLLNLITGDFYIGSAVCFRTRFNQHLSKINKGKHHNKHFESAYHKYGGSNFEFRIIEICAKDILYIREQYYLEVLNPVYNKQLKAGVWRGPERKTYSGGFIKGYIQSEETKVKRGRAQSRWRKINHFRTHALLDEKKVSEIRQLFPILSARKIALQYGVKKSTIENIKYGNSWKTVV